MARPEGTPHDALVKFVFKDPRHAGPLLESLLPERLAQAIDWSTLQRHDVTLIEPALRETRTDIVLTVQLSGRKTWIYVLFEHQSERDPWMALRLLGYMTRLWEDQRKEQGPPLAPILPVVLHHGERAWTEGTQLSDLFALAEQPLGLVREYCPDFRFIVDDLRPQDDTKLRHRALTELAQIALVLLRDGRTIDDIGRSLGPWLEAFRAVAAAPDGANALLAVFRYLSRVAQSEPHELLTFARDVGPIAEKATMTAAEQIAKEAEERGRRTGREEGREEGRELERRELVAKLITLRFGEPDQATLELLHRASAEQLSRCAELVIDASTLDEVLEPCR